MAHHDNASGKVAQIFLQYLQREDVEVIGRLVEDEEVGVPHEHRAQIESTTLTTTELIDVAMLLLGWEEEVLQELRCRELLTPSHRDDLGYLSSDIDYLHLLIKLQSLLRIVAESHGLTDVEPSTIRRYLPHEQLEERALARTIISHDAQLLIA